MSNLKKRIESIDRTVIVATGQMSELLGESQEED